jgi:hypothetical protein
VYRLVAEEKRRSHTALSGRKVSGT